MSGSLLYNAFVRKGENRLFLNENTDIYMCEKEFDNEEKNGYAHG